jgi:uncharacterized protein YcfJ
MRIVCFNCGNISSDPGGEIGRYRCGLCGSPNLQRIPTEEDRNKETLAGLVVGAAIGAAFGGPPGALIGGLVGTLFGASRNRPPKSQR